jgi:hypothetical protein
MLYIAAIIFPILIIPVGVFTLINVIKYIREIHAENRRDPK